MKTNTKNENLTFIKLQDLFLSEHNVRTVPATKGEDKLLRASIKAQGITQNLIVVKSGKKYAVIAGGRRLTQLNTLLEEGIIHSNYLVPCLIESEDNISALSLAENIKATMHPADEFMAFQSMINEGKTVADISNEFGITQTQVKKRLKLAAVAPELVQYYRKGKIDLDAVMAFTVSDDHEKQLACYKELSAHYMRPWHIKKYLLDEAVSTDNPLVQFVTLKAFKKAGGSVTTDLFESTAYINEQDLLESLATDRLHKKAQTLSKQWKWVEVTLSQQDRIGYQARLQPEYVNVPEKLDTLLAEKNAELDALYNKEDQTWSEDDSALEECLNAEIHTLEDKRDSYRQFTDEQKAVSGAVVSIDYNGELSVSYGYVKKEDMAEAFPKEEAEVTDLSERAGCIESNALKTDLHHFRLQALQSQIMKNDKLAYDLMVYTLAKSLFHQNGYHAKALNIDISASTLTQTNGIEDTQAAQAIESVKANLGIAWLSHSTEEEKFSAFRALSSVQKKRLLSFCVVQSYQAHTELDSNVTQALDFTMAQHWTPTAENYFKRIKMNDLIAIGREQIGEEWANTCAKLPKAKLVEHLSVHNDMADWMPQPMR